MIDGRYLTTRAERRRSKAYRDRMRAAELCINGANHGIATHGCRCQACHEIAHPPPDPQPVWVIAVKRSERTPWELTAWTGRVQRDAFAAAFAVEVTEPRFYAMRAVEL